MYKALSILEIIIVILIIAIILTFAIPKFNSISYNSNLTKLKSDVFLIQNGINELKKKSILLQNENSEVILDEASVNTSSQKLFENILQFPLISSSKNEYKEASWIKISSSSYSYVLSKEQIVSFKLSNDVFECKSPDEICKDLY